MADDKPGKFKVTDIEDLAVTNFFRAIETEDTSYSILVERADANEQVILGKIRKGLSQQIGGMDATFVGVDQSMANLRMIINVSQNGNVLDLVNKQLPNVMKEIRGTRNHKKSGDFDDILEMFTHMRDRYSILIEFIDYNKLKFDSSGTVLVNPVEQFELAALRIFKYDSVLAGKVADIVGKTKLENAAKSAQSFSTFYKPAEENQYKGHIVKHFEDFPDIKIHVEFVKTLLTTPSSYHSFYTMRHVFFELNKNTTMILEPHEYIASALENLGMLLQELHDMQDMAIDHHTPHPSFDYPVRKYLGRAIHAILKSNLGDIKDINDCFENSGLTITTGHNNIYDFFGNNRVLASINQIRGTIQKVLEIVTNQLTILQGQLVNVLIEMKQQLKTINIMMDAMMILLQIVQEVNSDTIPTNVINAHQSFKQLFETINPVSKDTTFYESLKIILNIQQDAILTPSAQPFSLNIPAINKLDNALPKNEDNIQSLRENFNSFVENNEPIKKIEEFMKVFETLQEPKSTDEYISNLGSLNKILQDKITQGTQSIRNINAPKMNLKYKYGQ